MGAMQKALPLVLIAALIAIFPAPPIRAAGAQATPVPAHSGTPPPQIYHIITRPLCSELRSHIKPAIGMMLQNDKQIGKSPDLFQRYNRGALSGTNNTVSNANGMQGGVTLDDSTTSNAAQNMALLGMENLVSPIANNIIAIKKLLDSPALTTGTGRAEDDKHLQEIRAKLLKALATQSAALDIINGFVDTQQMADLQHSGQEYISATTQSDFRGKSAALASGPATPIPGMANPDNAGLPQNPYDINLAEIPGLTLGYNPVTRLVDALHWTIAETASRENEASKAVMESASICANTAPAAAPH